MTAPPDPNQKYNSQTIAASKSASLSATAKGFGSQAKSMPAVKQQRFDARSWRYSLLAICALALGSLLTLLVEPSARRDSWAWWQPGWWLRPLILNPNAGLTALPEAEVHDLLISDLSTLLATAESGLIYRQANGTERWTVIEPPGLEETFIGLFNRGGAALGAFTRTGTVWISDDDGVHWEPLPDRIDAGRREPLLISNFEYHYVDAFRKRSGPEDADASNREYGNFSQQKMPEEPFQQTLAPTVEPPFTLQQTLLSLDRRDVPTGVPLADIVARGTTSFLALSRRGELLFTINGGLTWQRPNGGWQEAFGLDRTVWPENAGLVPFQFQRKGDTIWMLGEVNSDYQREMGAVTAVMTILGDDVSTVLAAPDLLRISIASDGVLWGFNANGHGFRLPKEATEWQELPPFASESPPEFRAIAAQGQYRVVLAGTGGRIWQLYWNGDLLEVNPLSRQALASPAVGLRVLLPAPLFILLIIGLMAAAPRMLRRPIPVDEVADIAEIFVSDRPLKQSDVDYLNFAPYVRGLSSYLRNASTQPPLTVAITGAWGSGKTSMMSLLKEDLEGRGFCPVWFNAWHHQRDEGLLAALLQQVKSRAIPAATSREGLHYRWRLFIRRATENKVRSSLSALTFLAGCMLFFGLMIDPDFPIILAMDTFFGELIKVNNQGFLGYLGNFLTVLSGGAILAPVFYALRTLRSFGVKPSDLLMRAEGQISRKQLDEKASFRHRFSQEFADVADSLRPLSLVIMIDDLDRCQPGAVFEVLEAINFLSSSGKCFILLGMDEARVQDCVAANCRKMGIVPPRFDNGVAAAADKSSEFHDALQFARAYMEKMVQVRVAVPRADAEAAARLVAGEEGRPFADRPVRSTASTWFKHLGIAAASIGALTLGFGGAKWIKHHFQALQSLTQMSDSVISPVVTASAPSDFNPLITPPTGASDQLEDRFSLWLDRSPVDRLFDYGRSLDLTFVGVGLLGLGLFIMIYPHLLAPRMNVVVTDTPQFVAAARRWTPLVFARNPTPRNLKGYLNRVRYYAMLLRGEFGERFTVPDDIESSLVAFAAIEHAYPGWFRQSAAQLTQRLKAEPPPDETIRQKILTLREDPILQRYRRLFERLSRHVRM